MAKRNESMSIKEFMKQEKQQQIEIGDNTAQIRKIVTTSLIPITLLTPTWVFGAEPGVVATWARGQLYEKVVHTFEPIVGLIQALSYPIGLIVMLGGGLFVIIGNRKKVFL